MLAVERVGAGDVDDVEVGIGGELGVAAVRALDAVASREDLGGSAATRADGEQSSVLYLA